MAQKPTPVPAQAPISRQERVIASMFAAILGLSVAGMIALIIAGGTANGPIWAAVALVVFLGLPISIVLLIVLLVLNAVRRTRAAKGAGK